MSERLTPEYCTCGAPLVENARFCHMCGRPVFEPEVPDTSDIPAQVLASAAPQKTPGVSGRPVPLPVNFSNPLALRAAILVSLGVMLVAMIPGVQLLVPVWGLAAGWCAVLLYRRLTGFALSVRAGAQLGSITGVLTFVSLLIIMALTILAMGKDFSKEVIRQDPQITQVLNDPPALAVAVVVALVLIFGLVVGTCAAGGALGAKFAGRNGTNNQV
jgi:hypothetical protein